LTVGSKVFVSDITRNNGLPNLQYKTGTISKIGRKYFTVDFGGYCMEFIKETRYEKTDYSPSKRAYFTEQEIEDELESHELFNELRVLLDYRNKGEYSLHQYKKTIEILRDKNM